MFMYTVILNTNTVCVCVSCSRRGIKLAHPLPNSHISVRVIIIRNYDRTAAMIT